MVCRSQRDSPVLLRSHSLVHPIPVCTPVVLNFAVIFTFIVSPTEPSTEDMTNSLITESRILDDKLRDEHCDLEVVRL